MVRKVIQGCGGLLITIRYRFEICMLPYYGGYKFKLFLKFLHFNQLYIIAHHIVATFLNDFSHDRIKKTLTLFYK